LKIILDQDDGKLGDQTEYGKGAQLKWQFQGITGRWRKINGDGPAFELNPISMMGELKR